MIIIIKRVPTYFDMHLGTLGNKYGCIKRHVRIKLAGIKAHRQIACGIKSYACH